MSLPLENRPCGGRYGDLVQSIGNTPLVELKRLSPHPGVRIWAKLESRERQRWYRHRLLPTLRPLAALDVEHVLVTHGVPVMGEGRAALEAMLRADPVEFTPALVTGEALPAGAG